MESSMRCTSESSAYTKVNAFQSIPRASHLSMRVGGRGMRVWLPHKRGTAPCGRSLGSAFAAGMASLCRCTAVTAARTRVASSERAPAAKVEEEVRLAGVYEHHDDRPIDCPLRVAHRLERWSDDRVPSGARLGRQGERW